MRRLPLLVPLLLIILVSCTGRVATFELVLGDRSLPLTEEPGRRRAGEGVIPASLGAQESYALRLARPEEADLPAGRYLEISYAGDADGARLELLSNESGPAQAAAVVPFPGGSAGSVGAAEPTRFVVPLSDSQAFLGVRITRETPGEPFTVTALALVEPWSGVSVAEESLRLSAGSTLSRDLDARAWSIALPPPPGPDVPLRLRYAAEESAFEAFDGEPRSAELTVAGAVPDDEGEAGPLRLDLRLRPGRHEVQLYPQFLGFSPRELRLASGGVPFRFEAAAWETAPDAAPGTVLPAELATVLGHRPAPGDTDFSLFRWNLYPEILVMDFDSYEAQSSYLKRLAFFVEKLGYRGRVASFQELAGRHGWNAHNYSPEGLAAFFSAADQISQQEERLKALALQEGIIRRESGAAGGAVYVHGGGGVISVSQESPPLLRELLLTHEAMHGVFYSEPEFVEAVWSIWESQSEPFREAWRFFLASMTYDPEDEYLMVNEFQAYLLQQPLDAVEAYLNWRIAGRIRARDPEAGRFSDAFLAQFVRDSVQAARRINEALFRTSGLVGGDVLCLVPTDFP